MERYRLSHAASPPPAVPPSASDQNTGVTVIPALKSCRGKIHVAAYCRVSTDEDAQKSSIENQQIHYEHFILSHPEWSFAGIYIDEGMSGTSADARPELQKMLSDCRAGKINLILTKSISRFARNLTDCLSIIRELKRINVFIIFEKEHIDTGAMSSELMLSLLSCFAEEESRSISSNLKWGIRKRFINGTFIPSSVPYGYSLQDRELVINAEEAAVLRQIFTLLLSGSGLPSIAESLNEENVSSPTGSLWTQSSLRSIVRNPVYAGDLLLQKTYTDDRFHSHWNTGQLDRYLYESHHEAVIDRNTFEKAQILISQHARELGYREGNDPHRAGNRYPFTGILYCSSCGSILHRQAWSPTQISWVCTAHKEKKCSMRPQSEVDLKSSFITCMNKITWSQKRRKRYNRILNFVSPSAELDTLRHLINRWQITDDLSSFPGEKFRILVDHCLVDTCKTVTFHFRCGLVLTESFVPTLIAPENTEVLP